MDYTYNIKEKLKADIAVRDGIAVGDVSYGKLCSELQNIGVIVPGK